MKIAIPLTDGKLSAHFGHCQQFAIMEADQTTGKTGAQTLLTPPAHEPGVYPAWLAGQGATHIIAGGMGQQAQNLFAQSGIQVIIGAPAEDPAAIVNLFLKGKLQTGTNLCDH